jgi:hypothetical protein
MSERFFMDTDGDCHWYIVPAEHRAAWEAWKASGEEGNMPIVVTAIMSHPSRITFESPKDHTWGAVAAKPKDEKHSCQKPPTGWLCSREAGHPGPCAAYPVGGVRSMGKQRQG